MSVGRPASRPAGLDPTAPHSLISPPAVASPGLEAGRQSAASHLFPIAPSPPSPKCLDGQRTTSQARGKAARQEEEAEVEGGAGRDEGEGRGGQIGGETAAQQSLALCCRVNGGVRGHQSGLGWTSEGLPPPMLCRLLTGS